MAIKTFTAGSVLTSSDTNTYLNDGGLVLITSGITVSSAGGTAATVSNGTVTIGSGNTSLTVSNAFSSTYDNYKIVVGGFQSSTAANVRFQFSGLTTNVYNYGFYFATAGSAANGSANNVSYWAVGNVNADTGNSFNMDVYNPFLASFRNTFTGNFFGNNEVGFTGGQTSDTASRSGFILTLSAGSFTSGTIRVYGYRKP